MSRSRLLITVLLCIVFVSACSSDSEDAAERTPLNVQLSWIHEYSSAPFYAAQQNDHFTEQGLNVTLLEGGFSEDGYIDPIQQVVSGNADFSLSDGASVITARANGEPVVAVAAVLQRSPLAVISLEGTGINRPQDLEGRSVSVAAGGAQTTFTALVQSQNVDTDAVNVVERTSFGVDPLVNGEVDALVGWIINEGVSIQEQGLQPHFVMMSDYGVDTYDFVVITTETMISENPEIVQQFVNALRAGMQDVVDNPENAIEQTLEYNEELNEAEQLRRLEATISLMNVPGQPLGVMDPRVWEFTHEILLEQGTLAEPITLSDAYNLSFIPTE